MYDAIVVGARCAGSPTAMLLARKGYNVLLVDKSSFPSDIMSTHYIHPPGVARLERWGLLDSVLATNAPIITKVISHMGEPPVAAPPPPPDAPPMKALCPRRTALDKVLVDAAVEAGAELREGFSVKELTKDGDRVTGIRGDGVTEEAKIVIGADGMRSVVAKEVNAEEYNTIPTLSFGYYAYWSGVDLVDAELYLMDGNGVLAFPTNDGMSCIAVGGKVEGFHEFRSDIEGNYMKILERAGSIGERVKAGNRETNFVGTADQPNLFRKPYGPGWALVGDAGYHRDFLTGLGITDAFRDLELLVDAIDDGFAGRRPIGEAMADYEAKRNEIAMPLYEFTTALARMEEAPQPDLFVSFGEAMRAMMPEGTPSAEGAKI